MKPSFGPTEIRRDLGLTRRQLYYWRDTGLFSPSAFTKNGGQRRYTDEDLKALQFIDNLVKHGISLQRIRSIVKALKKRFGKEWASLKFEIINLEDMVIFYETRDIQGSRQG